MSNFVEQVRKFVIKHAPKKFTERPVADSVILARFIFNKKFIKSGKIQYGAYVDNRYPSTLSVFNVTKLLRCSSTAPIWKLATLINKMQCRGRGDLLAGEIRRICSDCGASLPSIYTDPMFHSKHVNMTGLPVEEAMKQSVAQTLASRATLHIPN